MTARVAVAVATVALMAPAAAVADHSVLQAVQSAGAQGQAAMSGAPVGAAQATSRPAPTRAGAHLLHNPNPEDQELIVTDISRARQGAFREISEFKVWSYPIVKDGLIYVVDLRNGLYVLRYRGRCQGELDKTSFLEGNSNLGDALRFERSATKTSYAGGCKRRRGTAGAAEVTTSSAAPSSLPAPLGDFDGEDSLHRD